MTCRFCTIFLFTSVAILLSNKDSPTKISEKYQKCRLNAFVAAFATVTFGYLLSSSSSSRSLNGTFSRRRSQNWTYMRLAKSASSVIFRFSLSVRATLLEKIYFDAVDGFCHPPCMMVRSRRPERHCFSFSTTQKDQADIQKFFIVISGM